MYRCRLVLSWRIHSVQDQWIRAGIDELMLSPCWNYDQVSCLDILVFARDRRFAGTGSERQNLINCVFLQLMLAGPYRD